MDIKVLFIGDIFGNSSIELLAKKLPDIKKKYNIDFTIAQGENASGRKGLTKKDYDTLKQAGIDAFTMGNHIWAKSEIFDYIDNADIIRPYNVLDVYPGQGTKVFKVKGKTLRITSLMGIAFNELYNPWKQQYANNFFDALDEILEKEKTDYHIVDFHAETTSEKNVFGIYADGKVSALLGTHTHIQTSDARSLPKGTLYITDVGMVGPINSAIGAEWESVYKKMRYGAMNKFEVSNNKIQMEAVILNLNKDGKNKIKAIKSYL